MFELYRNNKHNAKDLWNNTLDISI